MRLVLLILISLVVSGCAYNEITILAYGDVWCNANVDKPVSTSTLPMDLKARDVQVPLVP